MTMDHVWIVEWTYRDEKPAKWRLCGLPYKIDAFQTREEALKLCWNLKSCGSTNLYRVRRYDRSAT
jgi:hypothetical protein